MNGTTDRASMRPKPSHGDTVEKSVPPPIEDHVDRVQTTLERAPHVLCCLDFDGTLAPIVSDPSEARIRSETEPVLRTLVERPTVTVAIVSGRSVDDLRDRVDANAILVGNHGLELDRPGNGSEPADRPGNGSESADRPRNGSEPADRPGNGSEPADRPGDEGGPANRPATHPLADAARRDLGRLCDVLEDRLAGIEGTSVEEKGLTATIHVRSVADDLIPTVERVVMETAEEIGGDRFSMRRGRAIVEVEPAVEWSKGHAVSLLAAECPPETAVLVAGDDTTDESAFRAVRPDGIGVLVGEPRPSHAVYRTRSPATVTEMLGLVRDATTRSVGHEG